MLHRADQTAKLTNIRQLNITLIDS